MQLGTVYGAMNVTGRPADAAALIAEAASLGIRTLDTAQAYGGSEQILGELLGRSPRSTFDVISKIAPDTDSCDRNAVLHRARESVRRIGQALYGLMYHDPGAISVWRQGAGNALKAAREEGLCRKIGVSVYTPEEAAHAVSETDIDIVQVPFNILDRRLEKQGLIDKAIDRGCEVHIRSLFLQGVLIADPVAIPSHLGFIRPWVETVSRICDRYSVSASALAIGYVRQRFPAARLVIGCDTAEQVRANAALFDNGDLVPELVAEIGNLDLPPERVVNPALWQAAPA